MGYGKNQSSILIMIYSIIFFQAGQERFVMFSKKILNFFFLLNIRFRSITQQYFRKSDGIILIYDVTSEITFRNVREWMISIQVCFFCCFLHKKILLLLI
jgi:GTPase SAR1 family protein